MDDNIKKLHQALIDDGYDDVGTEQEFRDYVSDSKNVATLYNALSEAGYDNFKDQKSLETYLSAKAPVAQKPSTPQSSGQSVSAKEKKQTQYPQEVIDAFNSPDNKPGNFKDLAQLNDEYQRGELKKPGIISQALGMFSNVDAGNIGKEQKVGGMIANMLLGDNMQQPHDNNQQVQHLNQDNVPATEQTKPTAKDADAITSAAPVQQVDAIYNKYVGKGDALSETMYDLMASGQAKNQEEAQNMAMGAMNRAASRLAQRTTDEFVSKLGDTVEGVDEAVMNGWHSHAVQDNLKKLASQYGIMNNVAVDENGQFITQTNGYDQFINGMVKPAMVESLVKKYGENYRKTAEDLATRLYSNDEVIQNQLMNQDIDEAFSSVISKYVNPSVVDEYNKAQEAGSKAFTEGMEGSQFIPANLRLGTALGAQYEANEAKDPAKVLSSLQKKFGRLYRNPEFLNDMSNAAFKVMQRYGLNGTQSSDPKQFKPMINSVLKNELDQLEIKGMMPKGSAEYIMKTGVGNTIVGKIIRKTVQTDYQNWLEDIANQQYQPGFWENVASGALTFAGDAWSYWLPGAAGGKLTKSMIAKAEGKLAGDLMAKGMERRVAERAAKVLIGKSKAAALKSGAAHGAVTFGGQSAISKPIDEIYRTGQFDENGKIYNPSVGKVIANTLGEVAKQSAVGAIMQGGTIANMVGKGRGLATNILADIGGKVADSGIMTGQQLLERMAHDPNFKPTGKDAAESFLESMANLTAIGLPGMVGKYARFKDAREFNKKFDFTDQDIAELKRFGYDGLRDAFEKMGIGEYAVVGENAQRLDGQLTQKYMDLMNDKSVPEVLKAKMMAVVEGKRPSSFSPVVDSIIVQPMDNDGKVYLETLNKDGGIVERKEFASLDEAQKADKKLEYEKTLGLASVLEGEFHNEFTQEHLDGLYNKAAQKYNMGEKLTDEDKAAVYLHQNAGAIKEIMDKQQKGIILTDEEQKQVNAYRHYYDSALENSSVMREFVNTFEDSHGVARGTLRKALESKDKKYAPLVESYLKELYNSIELKREMKQIEDDKKRIEQGDVDGVKPATPVEGPASVEGSAGGQEPPVSEEPAPYQDRTNSVPTPSDAEVAASPANSAAEGAVNEPKVASSDAFVMGQTAYKNGDSEALQAIDYNSDLATGRLKRAFADNEKMPDIVANAYSEGKDMDLFVAQRAGSLTPAQKEAISKYVEAMDAKKGTIDALQHADDGYGEALKQQLWPYQTEDGNIVPATLDSGKQVFLKKANEYGGAFVVVPDEQGQPTIKQVSNAEIKEMGTPVSLNEYIENAVAQQKDARAQQFISQFDGSGLKPNDQVTVAMEEGDANVNMTFAGYSEDGKIVLTDGKDYLPLSKEEFAAWRKNALDNTINQHLDAEDVEREQAQIKKAEADKQERYKKGIFGYAAGKPDYSDTQTDPKVAAEYLQETAGEDRKALFANIVAEKQALQKRISQLREHIANNEEWLSLNADLDPENAETRSLANKQMQGQIVDLQARFDNWNKIRSSVMTPEEAEAIKADRTKKIAEAGVNDGDVAPVEGREIAVLSDEELKKQYPTMDEASSYITSERKKIYRIQSDEVQREIDGVDEVLDRYVNGEIDLEPEQLKELNTTKAQLQARQQNLTESAKDLKAQADKLKTLYRKENMEARAKAMENMTPAEQRAVKVENAIKTGNLSLLNAIYEEVRGATDFTDTEPNTIEEYVASNIGRFSLNYEGKDKAGVLSNGIKQETGLGRKDFDKLQILAKEGEGKTVPEFVHSLYDNMPEQLKQMGYSDQDIRDAFLNLISSVENYSDLKNYTLNNKVAEAEQQLRTLEHQEEEMMEKATSYEINDETAPFADRLETAISETETNPTDAQKKAGNYKKGHLSFGGYDFTVETPKGVTRSGKDEQGKPWSVTMHDTYGYILGKIGVDGDHIDMFINDAADLDTFDGNVYVVDQVNPETGEFDEHKVMYGYPDEAAATKAYLSNYSKGWKGLGKITSVPKATFDKWLESSDRKTKPFRDYAMIQHEKAKKAKQANEALPFDAPMSMDDLPFHRDMKEVKPSEMTEAQKLAYDAVSTMLKKAGIPVKVVSNEDMEKVAEAQDNLAVEMLLNDPRLRFYIKTPEQKEAAKAAYDWAAKNRPDKFKQYAIVNMNNPNQPPQYFEKKDLAEKWRKYYTNAWKIGNYKAFNLNKPFEEQIKDVKGDVPSEFDPYKAESLLNKRIELEKQIKETEDSYNAKKKERAEYQNQLMQDYMDQHGLSSENDIPDDVWTDYRDKSFEKYQDTLDDLFHKYVELDNQLKAVAEPGVQYLKGKGVVYGYTDGKEIVLNQEHLNPNTPIHEYQHLWRTAAKNMNPELIEHGDKLIMQTQLFADLKQDPNYNHLTDEQICDEAFARLTGEDGAAILEQMAKDAIKENPLDTAKELSVINKLKEWLKKFWYWTLDTFTKWKPEDIKKMTLEDIRNLVLRDLANGVDPRTKVSKSDITKENVELEEVNKTFNQRLDELVENPNQKDKILRLGRSSTFLKAGGIADAEIELDFDKLMRKSKQGYVHEHPFDATDVKDLPMAIANPISVFNNTNGRNDGQVILTELKKENRNFIVAIQTENQNRKGGVVLKVNKIVTLFPKDARGVINWFNQGKATNIDKEKALHFIEALQNHSGTTITDEELKSAANIINSFETAKENGENLSVEDKIKAVSQQFGVDQADVAMYANAIKKGSTAEAARARANIKRHLLQANEDKISSFKELLKYTVPVNEALKKNFGDVDAMIEERKQQMEAQRNAMEAARKRAEEEEAKRQKHLEELSLIPDDQLDKQYMDALAKGDDATAREMLDEAARRKGYDDTESAYQGVGAWAAPGNPGYESDKARRDDWESSGSDVNLEDIALGYTPQPSDYFSHPERYSQNTLHGLESVKAINTAIDAIKNGEKDVKVKVYRAVPTSVKEGKLRNGDWVTPSKKYAEMHGSNRLEGKYRIIEDEVPATQLWWDGNDANEFGFDDGKVYKYKNAKNNRKLNDLVTYDDKGDVIPPSKRFNSRKSDVRFHRVTEVKSPIMEQKLQKHPDSLMKAGTYFSGGGLVEEGLKGIIDPVVAVEYDRKISGVYRNNFGQHIVTADVRNVDPKELVKHIDGEVEYFHASPVCKNYSQAKSNSGEVELDKETAKSTADFIDAVKPRVVTIENVKGYKDSEAMKIITKALDKNGYTWDSDVYNAADYGGYTSRERLIVRAVKDGELPEKPKKQPRKGGWLEAVEDILPTLTVKESGVAPWMDARLKVDGIDWQKVEKPLYVMGSAYADGKIPHAYGDEILPTLRTKSGDVIIMPGGKVLRADGRVLARITGLGDDYKLPKTESLAHTIIGNGIPVQLTQGVIAPLLNKDDLSGRNVLARLGSSIFKNNWDADKQKQVSDRVVNTANKLGGAEATVYTSVDEVPDAYLSDVKNGATGWYDPTTHTVHVYLPNCADANEAERTVLHEKIGHEGMEVLLGGEDGVRKFANFVYRSVGKDVRGKIIDFANKYDPDWKNPDRMNVGTQEYIAHLAEEGPKAAEDFSLWTKIKHYLIKVLKKLGVRVPGLLNDKDLRYYLMKAGKALHVWDEMPETQQEAMMKQASNAEIKDALSNGPGKGKPQMKKGESTIQYIKRVQEWRKWQNAREDKENPEPPMFYDIDKDEAGKKEWAQLNKDWRERHHLVGEEPTGMPIRMENEEDDAYMNRIHEYEKWQVAMKDQEDPLPDMFAFEKKKQEEVKRKYEDWLAKHDLLEQQQADLDLYEGKIYPAETNPKADALEQQVMQDLAEVTSTDVSKEGAAKTVKYAVIHRRKNMEEASADDAIYINDVKNRIEKMADSGAFDKLLSDYQGKPNRAEKLAEAIPYIIEAPRRLRDLAHDLNATGAFDKGHIHIQPADVEAIQPFVADLITETGKKHTELKDGKEVELYDDPQTVGEVASKMAQAINANHQGEEGFVPIDGSDILSEHVLPLVKQQIVPKGIDYKNLSPEMKAALDSIRDWYNYTYDWLRDNHTLREDTGYNADYVNHIWDKEKSDKQAYAMYVENRQRTKSPNEKKRTISTLMEGISVGLVPKTTDITKMMAYYSRSNIEAWVNKTMLQELSGLNVIKRNEDGEIVSSDPLLSSTPPFNLEQYQYFEIPGVGPVWVYNESPKQVKVKNPITGKEKVLYSEASAGDRFGVVFDTYQSSPFWKTFDTLASSAKKLELGFSGFHAGALTEVYMVQNMVEFGPKKAMANFMKYIFVDTMKNHQLPCFANPEDFQEAASHLVKFGATNDYAAADVQNMFDNLRDFAQKLQKKLEERGNIGTAAGAATIPFEIATQMVSMLNKGMDVALWDFIHDGLKLATYRMRADRTKERAKKYGWTDEQLSKALDEDGQFVNDMFGGQHWDILGVSQRTFKIAGRVLLSPDWNVSTTRHFMAMTGLGSVWNEATLEDFKNYYNHVWAAARGKEPIPPEYFGRKQRQISALICYFIGFLFYEAYANAHNAAFRALDEEKERKKAEEIRKTNPSYKSMYELAYPDGMKWYDYLMQGNSLGQQSKIFLGRYADGTEMYIRHGKQFREVPEYLFNHKGELEFPGPMVQRMIGKANPMVRMTLDDINYLSDFQASHADQEIQRKYGKTIGLLYKDALYWAPFLIPSQENKEFKAVDFFFPSSKGFSPWKAQSYFKDFILSGDMEGVVMTYQSCQRNGIDPEAQIKAAIGSVKALESAEMSDGVTSLQEASKRFDTAKSITEKKKMRQKMKKFLSQSDYKAFTQKEALDMVQGYLNGDEDLKEMEKAESKYLMKAKAEDVTEDWRIQNVWNGTMKTYQEYQRLKDVDKAKANAFKNSKTNKRLFAARKAISAARRKMNKAKKQMDGTNDAAKLVEIRNTRKELLKTLNGME